MLLGPFLFFISLNVVRYEKKTVWRQVEGNWLAWLRMGTLLYLALDGVGGCRLETCFNEYSAALRRGGLKDPESTAPYCQHLKAYGSCVKAESKSCPGDLQYHTTRTIISTLTKRFNCARFRQKAQRQECSYRERPSYSYCTLYGRPHLLTFSALYHNCKLRGSTPLVDNEFFSVRVFASNIQSTDSPLSQINVTIKAEGSPCASKKEYVAYADQGLAPMFTDQTQVGGRDNSIMINSSSELDTEDVFIYMRYIDTTVTIKKFGTYLGLSCRMPSDIISFDPGGAELCRSGCAEDNLLDLESARSEQRLWRSATEKCWKAGAPTPRSWRPRHRCLFQVISSSSQSTTAATTVTDELKQSSTSPQPPTIVTSPGRREDREISGSKSLRVGVGPFLIYLSFFFVAIL